MTKDERERATLRVNSLAASFGGEDSYPISLELIKHGVATALEAKIQKAIQNQAKAVKIADLVHMAIILDEMDDQESDTEDGSNEKEWKAPDGEAH